MTDYVVPVNWRVVKYLYEQCGKDAAFLARMYGIHKSLVVAKIQIEGWKRKI